MTTKAEHRARGAAGEEAAARFLLEQGWRVVERNWRPAGAASGLELDIIARRHDVLVFVEVKTRAASPLAKAARHAAPDAPAGVPAHAGFTVQKQRRLVRAAGRYLTARGLWHMPCRFDLICVEQRPDGRMDVEQYSNVIELGHSLDSGDASWQPW